MSVTWERLSYPVYRDGDCGDVAVDAVDDRDVFEENKCPRRRARSM
jgi:hypothetical protein